MKFKFFQRDKVFNFAVDIKVTLIILALLLAVYQLSINQLVNILITILVIRAICGILFGIHNLTNKKNVPDNSVTLFISGAILMLA